MANLDLPAELIQALEAAGALPEKPTPGQLAKFHAQFPEHGRMAVLQHELRIRARAKFSRAAEMLFTRPGLEMATHEAVARYHASLFPEGAPVLDLTAGIGADAMALAERGPVTAFEQDFETARCTAWNLALLNCFDSVRVEDSANAHGDFLFADPARRDANRRTVDPEAFHPNPRAIADRACELGVMKLTPLLSDDVLAGLGPQVRFVSFRGECREALILWGESVSAKGISAVQLDSGETLPRTEPPLSGEPGAYLHDADPAAVRAHALGSFGLSPLGDLPGYLTGPAPIFSPWLRTYEILHAGPPDQKKTQAALKSLGARVIEVKQRGAGLNADETRKRFRPEGDRPVSLVAYRVGKSIRFLLVTSTGP